MSVVERIRSASRQMVRELGLLNRANSEAGVTYAQGHALLEFAAGDLSVSALAARLRLDKSTASRTVGELARRGWIGPLPAGHDGRRKEFRITDRGKARVRAIHRVASGQVSQALRHAGPEDAERIARGLELYAEALAAARILSEVRIRSVAASDDPVIARLIRRVVRE
ncbi:MAG: MarR family winged helix-turn-helix transcriptional regulator, partial [Candidatus Eremiobacterota bacterium]